VGVAVVKAAKAAYHNGMKDKDPTQTVVQGGRNHTSSAILEDLIRQASAAHLIEVLRPGEEDLCQHRWQSSLFCC